MNKDCFSEIIRFYTSLVNFGFRHTLMARLEVEEELQMHVFS